ncbi:MAG: Dyp-type peroxidase [Actinomycetota bacterium]
MPTPQEGIFALGTSSHAYLEFDATGDGPGPSPSGRGAARGVDDDRRRGNLVVGFRPRRAVAPDDAPDGVSGFDEDLVGVDGAGCPRPSTTVLRVLGQRVRRRVRSGTRRGIGGLGGLATLAEESSSWPYQRDRDLTGFIDGTENPSLIDAPEVALIPEGAPGAGGTVLLLQRWPHDVGAWESLPVHEQERVIGRTKDASIELEEQPEGSHVASTDQERFGKIFRRNMPFGTVTEHGTMLVGFSADQQRLVAMLRSMAGLPGGVPDALTRYSRPVTGAYYFVPSNAALRRLAPEPDDPDA